MFRCGAGKRGKAAWLPAHLRRDLWSNKSNVAEQALDRSLVVVAQLEFVVHQVFGDDVDTVLFDTVKWLEPSVPRLGTFGGAEVSVSSQTIR